MVKNNMIFLFIFLLPFVAGLFLMPFFIRLSEKTGKLVDEADSSDYLKIHKKNISVLGGSAIFISTSLGFLLHFFSYGVSLKILAVWAGFLLFFLLMIFDDLKWKKTKESKPFLKFFLLLLVSFLSALILYFSGIKVSFFPAAAFAVILNFIYIFLFINSINYQDGMDGQAGGLAVISLAGFLFLGINDNFILGISLASFGAVASFLVFNFPPAKIFMGDSGAYSLGFILSALAMYFSRDFSLANFLGPIFIGGLPVFDGIYTNLRRLVKRKSIFSGDRSHFYDRLLLRGFSTRQTLGISCFLQIIFVVLGIIIYEV